jgi:glycosyltransferase involved in cell wall biosynthesis
MPRSLINLFIRQCDGIIVHGEQLRVAAEIALPVHPANIYTFPHPPLIHYSEIAKQRGFAKPNDGIFRVLFFGRICEYKGLKDLLDAVPLVHARMPSIHFIIAGQGDDLPKYEGRIRQLDYVRVHNRYISLEECALLFFEADLVVLPYVEASQSGVLMIAMAFGLPVVVTDVGEMATTVRSTGMGIVVSPGDTTALTSAIIDVARDNHLSQELSTRAKRAISHNYSREALSCHLLHIYETVLNRRKNLPNAQSKSSLRGFAADRQGL